MKASGCVGVMLVMAMAIVTTDDQTPGAVTPPPKPSAIVNGVVIDLITRAPVRFAVIRIGPPDGRGFDRAATADAEGRFTFTAIPGGTYVLSASAPNYLPSALGQKRFGGPGTPIEIADGHTLNNVAIPMTRGGVISGRVVDDYGDAVPGLMVSAMQAAFDDGGRTLVNAPPSRTDDQGSFRLFMLRPGQYYVFAHQNPPSTLGTIESAGPVSTYFPSSTDPASAQRVAVLAGRETAGVDIVLVSTRLGRLRGRAVMSTGAPFAGGTIGVHSRFGSTMSTYGGTTVTPDGSFEVLGVAPGQYVLAVRPSGAGPDDDVETGRVEITVAGENIDDITIVGSRGSVLRGLIVAEGNDPLPLASQALTVRPMPAADERGGYMPRTAVKDDYTFELKNLFGRHKLEIDIAGLPPHWAIKNIRWRGEDVTHTPFDFHGQLVEGVEVVMSDQWATLSGVVRDSLGAAVTDAPLVLFPVDEALRIPGSRYLRGFRTDRRGHFGISWLLPGDYWLASPREMEQDQWNDHAFLKSLVDGAARVTLADADERDIELRVRTQQ